jgi:uncharacterized protein YndB with AHSA1/START domain
VTEYPEYTVSSVEVEIAAPAAFVWAVLVDFAHYPQWNPFTVRVDTTLELGAPVELTLASGLVSREYIRVVDPPRRLRYDTGDELPGILGAREQWITGHGPRRCAYRTTDTFSGRHAARVFEQSGGWVKVGFDAVAHALKARVEELRADPPACRRSS